MKVTAILHRPTTDPAGAEQMLGAMLTDLASRGHEVAVVIPSLGNGPLTPPIPHTRVIPSDLAEEPSVAAADVLLTHLDATVPAVSAAAALSKPLVAVQHNTYRHHRNLVARHRPITGIVMTSEWMAQEWQATRPAVPRCLVHPPVNPADYHATPGEFITQINLFKNGALLYAVARLLPDHKFLAVKGGYGRQSVPGTVPSNVEVIDVSDDVVWDVYARTRVLMVPSLYESWGRVALEAASSGIPVIAAQVPGLQAALGYAGLFRDPTSPMQWAAAVRALDDPEVYAAYAALSLRRSGDVWTRTKGQLDDFEAFLLRQVQASR